MYEVYINKKYRIPETIWARSIAFNTFAIFASDPSCSTVLNACPFIDDQVCWIQKYLDSHGDRLIRCLIHSLT